MNKVHNVDKEKHSFCEVITWSFNLVTKKIF